MASISAEQQAASNVFDSLTPQQQSELVSYAERLLKEETQWNSNIRQQTLKAISETKNANASSTFSAIDADKLAATLMPSAMARMPDNVRHAIIVKLREMLLAP